MSQGYLTVLKRPVITEKSTRMKDSGNQYVFEVEKKATKPAIRTAVEKAFKVKVLEVNTLVVRGKKKTVGRYVGRRPNWKKAVVTLKAGDTIQMAEGV